MIDPSAFQMLMKVLTGWLERREREAIAYLIQENRLLKGAEIRSRAGESNAASQ